MATKHICFQNNNLTSYPISFLSSFQLQNICADDSEDKSGVCEHQSGSRFEKGILVAEKKCTFFFNVEISIVQIVNKLSPCKFYSQLLKKPSNLEEICYPWYFKSEQSFYFALYNIQILMLLQNFVEEKKNLTSYIYNH